MFESVLEAGKLRLDQLHERGTRQQRVRPRLVLGSYPLHSQLISDLETASMVIARQGNMLDSFSRLCFLCGNRQVDTCGSDTEASVIKESMRITCSPTSVASARLCCDVLSAHARLASLA